MSTKDIERDGLDAFKRYLNDLYGRDRYDIDDIRNQGKTKEYGCDLILRVGGQEVYVELKASRSKGLPTNIRFTHQTIATMHKRGKLKDMIVVYVYNLSEGPEKARFKFFKFGSFKTDDVNVEPHFIIQPKRITLACSQEGRACPIKDSLSDALASEPAKQEVQQLFDKRVGDYMKLK